VENPNTDGTLGKIALIVNLSKYVEVMINSANYPSQEEAKAAMESTIYFYYFENMTNGLSQKGTYSYMAPEVVYGDKYDSRVDTYSLGLMLYRLLNNNRMPFVDTQKPVVNANERKEANDLRIKGEPLLAPINASNEMSEIILKACEYNPDDRFTSATEMKNALLDVEKGLFVSKPRKKVVVSEPSPMFDDSTETIAVNSAIVPPRVDIQAPSISNVFPIEKYEQIDEKNESSSKKSTVAVIAIVVALAILLSSIFSSYDLPECRGFRFKLFDRSVRHKLKQ
jgi:serine/threonine protein kinase